MSSPPPHGATKGNSSRWILDAFDRAALEHAFRLDPFPNASMRQQLGNDLNVSPRQIQVWFQNRRQREKLHNPQGRAGPSARPDALTSPEALAGLKQKRDVQDILHMLKDMRPAAQLAHAASEHSKMNETMRVQDGRRAESSRRERAPRARAESARRERAESSRR